MGDLTENFSKSEFICKCGCGYDDIDMSLVNLLQRMRNNIGEIIITSGCRCDEYNKKVGGVRHSAHTKGLGVDVKCYDSRYRYYLINAALDEGVNRIGVHAHFVHLDIDADLPVQVIFLY